MKLAIQSFYILTFIGLSACTQNKKLFTFLSSSETGILFRNEIIETSEHNILTYEYYYNGGGVASADFNNDGLIDIYFTGNQVENKLYINKGKFKFEDITTLAGVNGRKNWKTGVSAVDINGDGWMDIFVNYSGPGTKESRINELYINQGCIKGNNPKFTEEASKYGLDAPGTFTTQTYFFDFDLDNDLDAFMVNHADMFYAPFKNSYKLRHTRHPYFGNRLYRNDNGKFNDISTQAGILGGGINFGLSAAISDYNFDGFPDIYVTNDYEEQDYFYLNNRDGTFREEAKNCFDHISKFSMGSDVADLNNDLKPDIITLDMLPEDNERQKLLKGPDDYDKYWLAVDSGYHHQNMRNMFQLHQGLDGNGLPMFSEIGLLSGISSTDWSWAALAADYDNDGYKDLFITNGYLKDFTNRDFLKYTYEEERNKAASEGKVVNPLEMVKKMPSTKVHNYIFKNNFNYQFTDESYKWGLEKKSISNGANYADLDNDGDLDLIINNLNEYAWIYENNTNTLLGNNYLKIKLKGEGKNRNGIGAKVILEMDSTSYMQEQYPARGFQSSVDYVLNFGIGKATSVYKVIVKWQDGKISEINNIRANKTIEIDELKTGKYQINEKKDPMFQYPFTDITESSKLNFVHRENKFVDFKSEILLPYQLSQQGPKLAIGDINKDGLEDIFVGGAGGQSGKVFLANKNLTFSSVLIPDFEKDKNCEDTGAAFFDADNDGDLDLYVVSGGHEFLNSLNLLQDRLYINDGNGNFSKEDKNSIPSEQNNGSCIAKSDFDHDGDIDIFIGSRSIPGAFGLIPKSMLLRNDTKDGKIKFTEKTIEICPGLPNAGMITDAKWVDIDNDKWDDLILSGDWMSLKVFKNVKGKLIDITGTSGLENEKGCWDKICADDFDNDGDIDLIVGNMGQNLAWKASKTEPLKMYVGDFDQNGHTEAIITSFVNGVSYPNASRDDLLDQLTFLKKKFNRYSLYANASLPEILDNDAILKAKTLEVNTLQSSYLENLGDGKFKIKSLPIEAQFSCIKGIISQDFNKDGNLDILIAGNFYPMSVQHGRIDAGKGLLMEGDGKGNFKAVTRERTNLLIKGDVRDIVELKTGFFVISKNNSPLQALLIKTRII